MHKVNNNRGNISELSEISASTEETQKPFIQSVQDENDFWLQIFEQSPHAYSITELESGIIIYINDAFTKVSGYTSEEVIGKLALSTNKLIPDCDLEVIKKSIAENRIVSGLEITLRRKDGIVRNVLLFAKIINANARSFVVTTIQDVTERKESEEKLRDNEQQLRTLSNSLPGGMVFELDIGESGTDRQFLYVSDGVRSLHGISPEDAIRDSSLIFNQYIEEDRTAISENENSALNDMGVFIVEGRVRLPSGEIRHRLTTSTLRRLANNHIVSDGIEIDITERKRNENLLSLEHDLALKLNTATDTQAWLEICINAAITVSEMDCGGIYLLNEQNHNLTLVAHKGLSDSFINSVSNYDAQSKNTALVLEGKPVYIDPGSFIADADLISEKLLTMAVIPVTHEKKVIGSLNIGSHVRSEIPPFSKTVLETIASRVGDSIIQLKTEEALRESEEKHRNIVEQFSEGLILTDEQGAVIEWNKACEKITGINARTVLGKKIWDVNFSMLPAEIRTPALLSGYQEEVLELCRTGKLPDRSHDTEGVFIRADGKPRNFRQTIFRIPAKDGFRFASIFADVTEHKRSEETILKAQRLESLAILAGGIAHDFNNLLAGIYGYIDLAYSETTEERPAGYLKSTMATIDRARALTKQLLTFAKGGSPMQQATSLVPFLQDTVQFALIGSNCSCVFDIEDNLRQCDIDKNQISQVLENISINALQAMPGGGQVEVSAVNIRLNDTALPVLSAGNYVKVSIKDHGQGIPQSILPHIFDPFYTTKTKGYGLGLATSYSIIKRHNGYIDVDTEPGKGSTFHIFLPAVIEKPADIDKSERIRHKGSGTVIIVDDEEVVRATVSAMLEMMGYTVICIDEGKAALDFYQKETGIGRQFSALFLDLTIPGGLGGKEIISELRKCSPDLTVFAMSGYADDNVMMSPAEYGFTASISKPFTIGQLSVILDNAFTNGA